MTIAHDDDATTWRDLSDQLTPTQIARLARQEAIIWQSRQEHPEWHKSETDAQVVTNFLAAARRESAANLTDQMINVPVPTTVKINDVEHWEDDGTGVWTRQLHGLSRNIPGFDAAVYLTGEQNLDGAVSWSLYVHVEDRAEMTAAQVRELAGALVEAAEELERLT